MSNDVSEQIHQVLGNLLRNFNITKTYVDEEEPWSCILSATEFTILSTTNRLKFYILVKFLFGSDIILPIKHEADW